MVQVVSVRGALVASLLQPLLCFGDQPLFGLDIQPADHDPRPQEHEVRVQHITTAVIVDLVGPTLVIKPLDHGSVDTGLARFSDQVRQQVQPTIDPGCAEVRHQIHQVNVRLDVVPIAGLVVGPRLDIEPLGQRDPVSVCRQFQHRQVVTPAVECHERRLAVVFPPFPELVGDHVGSVGGSVKNREVQQSKSTVDLRHGDRDRQHPCRRQHVATSLLESLGPEPLDRLTGRQVGVPVFRPCDQFTVGHGLHIEHQVTDHVGHRHSLHHSTTRTAAANRLAGTLP